MDEQETYRDSLKRRYKIAKREDKNLTPGRYMLDAYPHDYSNEESAGRAFRKVMNRETTGTRIEKREKVLWRRKETELSRRRRRTAKALGEPEPEREYEEYRGKFGGGAEPGLWKKILTVQYIDHDGETRTAEKSYIIQSSTYTSYLDSASIYNLTLDEDQNYLAYWSGDLYEWEDAEIISRELIRIERTNKSREVSVVLD